MKDECGDVALPILFVILVVAALGLYHEMTSEETAQRPETPSHLVETASND